MAHFPIMSIEQANPGLWRARQYGEIDRQNREAMFAPFTLAQELKKMQQFNQYYPEEVQSQNRSRNAYADLIGEQSRMYAPNILSEISHRGMQSQHLGAQNALLGEQTAGLQHTNNLNNRWQALEDAKYDVNNMMPSTQGSYNQGNDSNSILSSWVDLAPDVYASAHEINEQQDHNSPNYVPNLPSPLEQRKQYEQRMSTNVSPSAYPTITDTYTQAQQNNAPIQSANPVSVTEYMKNLGLVGNKGDMSTVPQQGQSFVPSPQNLNSFRQSAQSAAQMPAQMPAQFDSNARLNQINQQQAAIAARLGKGRVGAETIEQKMAREENKENLKEEHAIKKEDRNVYRKLSENANKVAKDAKMMTTLVSQFEDAYGKTKFKGPIKGMIPGKLSDANARLADNAAMNMQSIAAKMLGASKLTNYELKFAGNLKLNREMGREDTRVLADFMKAKTNRIEEEQRFLNSAKEKNISPEKAQQLWNEYDNDMPVYNFESRKVNKQNLGKSNEYLNPDKQTMTQEGGMVSIALPDGSEGEIPRSKLDEALRRGARAI